MFQVGDKILYGCNGACTIEGLSMMRFGRTKGQYYILRPLYQKTAVIYVPATNEMLLQQMCLMPTREDVDQMIADVPTSESIWIDDAQERKKHYDQIMRSSDCFARLRLIKTLQEHKKLRLSEGKNLHVSDENFLREAKKLICDEFAYPLQLEPSAVGEYINSRLEYNML